jgi:hypothetical protein
MTARSIVDHSSLGSTAGTGSSIHRRLRRVGEGSPSMAGRTL